MRRGLGYERVCKQQQGCKSGAKHLGAALGLQCERRRAHSTDGLWISGCTVRKHRERIAPGRSGSYSQCLELEDTTVDSDW